MSTRYILARVRVKHKIADTLKAWQTHLDLIDLIRRRIRMEVQKKVLSATMSPQSNNYVFNGHLVSQYMDECTTGQIEGQNGSTQARTPEKASSAPLKISLACCTHQAIDKKSTTTEVFKVESIS